ncbi:MAG: hypothetical protein IJM13_09685, partial [Lachnospiraceae bacterium]|nr:hypothetical protein [Lachnospiraceae bacterium]
MNLEKTIRNLELFGAEVKHFATAAEAADHLVSEITGTTVGIGGSQTVDRMVLLALQQFVILAATEEETAGAIVLEV